MLIVSWTLPDRHPFFSKDSIVLAPLNYCPFFSKFWLVFQKIIIYHMYDVKNLKIMVWEFKFFKRCKNLSFSILLHYSLFIFIIQLNSNSYFAYSSGVVQMCWMHECWLDHTQHLHSHAHRPPGLGLGSHGANETLALCIYTYKDNLLIL